MFGKSFSKENNINKITTLIDPIPYHIKKKKLDKFFAKTKKKLMAIQLLNTTSIKQIGLFKHESNKQLFWSPNAEFILFASHNPYNQTLIIRETKTTKKISEFKDEYIEMSNPWDIESKKLVFYNDNKITILDAKTCNVIKELIYEHELPYNESHYAKFQSAFFSSNSNCIFSISDNGKMRKWDIKTEKITETFDISIKPWASIELSTDKKLLAIHDSNMIRILDTQNCNEIKKIKVNNEGVLKSFRMKFSPDNKKIIYYYNNNDVLKKKVYKIKSNTQPKKTDIKIDNRRSHSKEELNSGLFYELTKNFDIPKTYQNQSVDKLSNIAIHDSKNYKIKKITTNTFTSSYFKNNFNYYFGNALTSFYRFELSPTGSHILLFKWLPKKYKNYNHHKQAIVLYELYPKKTLACLNNIENMPLADKLRLTGLVNNIHNGTSPQLHNDDYEAFVNFIAKMNPHISCTYNNSSNSITTKPINIKLTTKQQSDITIKINKEPIPPFFNMEVPTNLHKTIRDKIKKTREKNDLQKCDYIIGLF